MISIDVSLHWNDSCVKFEEASGWTQKGVQYVSQILSGESLSYSLKHLSKGDTGVIAQTWTEEKRSSRSGEFVAFMSILCPWNCLKWGCSKISNHYNDVITGTIASQITSITIVYSTVYSDANKKNQSSASLAFVRGSHGDRWIPRANGQ